MQGLRSLHDSRYGETARWRSPSFSSGAALAQTANPSTWRLRRLGGLQLHAADSKVCYVSSAPKASEPKSVKRDPAFFLVTHMPGRKPPVKGEVSTIIGYPFKEGSRCKLTIDDLEFEMFSKGDTAWVDTGNDKKIVTAMKAGQSLKVKGTSWRGTSTEDTYSLSGISAALGRHRQGLQVGHARWFGALLALALMLVAAPAEAGCAPEASRAMPIRSAASTSGRSPPALQPQRRGRALWFVLGPCRRAGRQGQAARLRHECRNV